MADNPNWLDQLLQSALAPKSQGNVLTDIGQILGSTAGGLAQGRQAEAGLTLGKGALDANLFEAALRRKAMETALPETRAKQAAAGDLLANVQDVSPTGPAWLRDHLVSFQGGRRPSALGPNARSAGAALSNIGASNIGKDVLPPVPASPNLPQSGILDKLLAAAGTGSSLAGALAKGGGGTTGAGDIGSLIKGIGGLFGHGGNQGGGGEFYGPTMDQLLGDVGPQPSQMGPQTGGIDTAQLHGGVSDPLQEYLDWLEQQQQGGAGGGSQASGDEQNWWDE